MNLTELEKNVIKVLSPISKEYLEAKFKAQIRTYNDYLLETKLKALVIKTLFESGVKDKNEDRVVTFLRETLFKDLKTAKFCGLTFEEVELAFSKGVRQEYGVYMGVNIQTMHGWLRAFLNSKERELAIKEFYAKASEMQFGKENRSAPVNPEGQKKVLEMLKGVVKAIPEEKEKERLVKLPKGKTPRDLYIQKCFDEFEELHFKKPLKTKHGKFIEFEGQKVDQIEYAEIKVKAYDNSLIEGNKQLEL